MRAIVKNLADTPMVLKGGTALYLGYGLNRFSEDLDFDCHKKINLLGRVKSAIPNGIILNDIQGQPIMKKESNTKSIKNHSNKLHLIQTTMPKKTTLKSQTTMK